MKQMTNCIVIGAKEINKEKKPIEFHKFLNSKLEIDKWSGADPKRWKYIELICLEYYQGIDLMFAYDDPEDRSNSVLIIGKWNDGSV